MAAEEPSSFDANPKGRAYSRSVRVRTVKMKDGSSSRIFVNGGRTDLISFAKNMIAEIFSIKTMSFWKSLDEGKTQREP
jgi:hypothetical protein